jgi:hypothetical protein
MDAVTLDDFVNSYRFNLINFKTMDAMTFILVAVITFVNFHAKPVDGCHYTTVIIQVPILRLVNLQVQYWH